MPCMHGSLSVSLLMEGPLSFSLHPIPTQLHSAVGNNRTARLHRLRSLVEPYCEAALPFSFVCVCVCAVHTTITAIHFQDRKRGGRKNSQLSLSLLLYVVCRETKEEIYSSRKRALGTKKWQARAVATTRHVPLV